MNHRPTLRLLLALLLCLLTTSLRADDWMAQLPDSTLVASMTIPGTHDAATGNGFLTRDSALAAVIATTQALPLSQQWSAGIRAFDLRPGVMTDAEGNCHLHIYHGEFATRITFDEALQLLADSLRAHPSEGAIVVMQHEGSPSRPREPWARLMGESLARQAGLFVAFRPDLRLTDWRGKILLISRDDYEGRPFGAMARSWTFSPDLSEQQSARLEASGGRAQLWVQDFYDTSAHHALRTKTRALAALWKQSVKASSRSIRPWIINHCSGYSITTDRLTGQPLSLSAGYRANASATNTKMLQLLARTQKGVGAGIVMMDFGGVDSSDGHAVRGRQLVRALIAHNTSR